MNRILNAFRNRNVDEEPKEDTNLNASFGDKKPEEEETQQDNRFLFFWQFCTAKEKAALLLTLVSVGMLIGLIVCSLLPYPRIYWYPEFKSDSILGKYKSAAVSTDAAPCATIGKDILKQGGNAVDAAIAALVCMGAVNPQSSGLGGGFLMLYYNRMSGVTHYIEAGERAPLKATEAMFQANESLAQLGGLALAVPGEIEGYEYAHKKYGFMNWSKLFEPTIKMCQKGIQVNAQLATALEKNAENLQKFENISKVFTNNETGNLYQLGETYTRPQLAKTLQTIADHQIHPNKTFYKTNNLVKDLLNDLKNAGSIINETDMNYYTPILRKPVTKTLRNNLKLHSVASPGTGALLAFVLGVLGGYDDLDSEVVWDRNATVRTLHRMVEAFKFAYARRMDFNHNQSGVISEAESELISEKYANDIRKLIDDKKTFSNVGSYGINVTVEEDHGAAHLSIIAPNGDAVSVSSTINTDFGSMVLSPSTGIIFNNQMDAFWRTSITNRNKIEGGRRPFSSISPAIITDSDGNVVMTIGGNGGMQITTSLAQVIFRTLWLGQNIKQAIDGPRFHHQLIPNHIEYEETFRKDILEDLKKLGHEFQSKKNDTLGNVMGVVREKGYLYANSDYRKGGDVDGY